MLEHQYDHRYYVHRMFESLEAAQRTSDGEAKLAHFEASGKHSVAASLLLQSGQASVCDKSTITASSFALRDTP
jgi:hypothetical protein